MARGIARVNWLDGFIGIMDDIDNLVNAAEQVREHCSNNCDNASSVNHNDDPVMNDGTLNDRHSPVIDDACGSTDNLDLVLDEEQMSNMTNDTDYQGPHKWRQSLRPAKSYRDEKPPRSLSLHSDSGVAGSRQDDSSLDMSIAVDGLSDPSPRSDRESEGDSERCV